MEVPGWYAPPVPVRQDDGMTDRERITRALYVAQSGIPDGSHHRMWVIDQMVRALTGCPMVERTRQVGPDSELTYETQGESSEYLDFIRRYQDGEDGPESYEWDTGIAP